jgi:short-subunit dehydrogenase involved in D-alanine esterification of teichoic acids
MNHALKLLGLLLLLLTAQQGSVIHELSHLSGANGTEINVDSGAANSPCALCPAYAQAASPAFSHSFTVPALVRAAFVVSAKPFIAVIEAAVPTARSRGPPVQN